MAVVKGGNAESQPPTKIKKKWKDININNKKLVRVQWRIRRMPPNQTCSYPQSRKKLAMDEGTKPGKWVIAFLCTQQYFCVTAAIFRCFV